MVPKLKKNDPVKSILQEIEDDDDVSQLSAVSEGDEDAFSKASSDTESVQSDVSSQGELLLAQEETRMVTRSKLLVVFVLLIASAVCGGATYIVTANNEEQAFLARVRCCCFLVFVCPTSRSCVLWNLDLM